MSMDPVRLFLFLSRSLFSWRQRQGWATGLCLVLAACARLPDVNYLKVPIDSPPVPRVVNGQGTLSDKDASSVLARRLGKSKVDVKILAGLEEAATGRPLIVGNKVTLLFDGPKTIAAMMAAVSVAKDSINLETYLFDQDPLGLKFADDLIAKQKEGVQVNIIYDCVGTLGTPQAFFDRMQTAGIRLLPYHPVSPLHKLGRWRLNNRDHRKILVVDGRIAFIGGINISSVYSSGSVLHSIGKADEPAIAWRDTDLQIEGPAVAEFQKLFMTTWEKQKGKPLAAKDYFPALAPQGKEIVRAIGSTPDDPYSQFYLTLISAIDNAEKELHITQAYFVPGSRLLKSLTDAAARGVDVRLVLPSRTDSESTFHAGRAHYSSLLKAGVKIFERRGALLHSKTAVIDGVWSCVGSSNLDWRSFLDNDEVNAVVLGREFAGQMETMFARDLSYSQAIDPAAWERRSLVLRIKEWWASTYQRAL